MCPRQFMKRQIGIMDFTLFKQIVDQIPSGKRVIHLHNFGEPLLDFQIFDKIRYCKKKGFSTRIFSNLNLLDSSMAQELLDSGLDDLKVSIDAVTKNRYESIRKGLRYDVLIKNITTLVELRRKSGSNKPRICVLCTDMPANQDEVSAFKKFWEEKVDKVIITKLHNWAEANDKSDKYHRLQLPCLRLWQTMTILQSGEAALCCMDFDGQVILGNAKEQSLREIWSGSRLSKIKSKHLTGKMEEISLCRSCELRR